MNKKQESLDNSLKTMAKFSIIVFVGLIFSKFLSYLFRMIIARFMHSEIYGLFTLASIITECWVAIFTLGLCVGVVRYIAIYRAKNDIKKIRYIVKLAVNSVIFSGIIGCILLLILSKYISTNIFHDPNLNLFLIIFSLVIPISGIGSIYISIIQAYEKMQWVTFIRNILFNFVELITLTSGVIIAIFLLNGDERFLLYAVIVAYVLGAFTLLIPSYLYCKYKLKEVFKESYLDKKTKAKIRKELFSYSWPLIFVGLVSFIFGWTDSLLIGYFKNSTAVGIYNAAVPIALLLVIAPQLFIYLFLPMITRGYIRDEIHMIKGLSKQVGKWIFMLNLPILVIIILFPEILINILFGSEYIRAAWPLRFLAIGIFFSSIFLISENLLSMRGKSKLVLSNLAIISIINILLNIILIPIPKIFGLDNSLGTIGASISTMISYLLWSILSLLIAKKYSGIIPLKRKMILIALITIIPALLITFTKRILPTNAITLIAQGFLFTLTYLLLIIITGCFDENDIMILKSIKNKIIQLRKAQPNSNNAKS